LHEQISKQKTGQTQSRNVGQNCQAFRKAYRKQSLPCKRKKGTGMNEPIEPKPVEDFRFTFDPSIDNYRMPYKDNLTNLVMSLADEAGYFDE
jgi:hypothetical protein